MGAVQVILLPALKPGHLFLTIHPLKMKCHLPKQHQPQYFILTKVSKLFCLFFLPLFSSILQLLTGSFVNNIRTLVFVSFIRAILCILHIFKKIQILSFGIGCWIRWARYLGIPYFLFEPILNRYAKSQYNHFFYLLTLCPWYVAHRFGRVEFWIFVLIFSTAPAWRKTMTNIWNLKSISMSYQVHKCEKLRISDFAINISAQNQIESKFWD